MTKRKKVIIILMATAYIVGLYFLTMVCIYEGSSLIEWLGNPVESEEQAAQIAREHVLEKYGDQFSDYDVEIEYPIYLDAGYWNKRWIFFYSNQEHETDFFLSDVGAPIVTVMWRNRKATSKLQE